MKKHNKNNNDNIRGTLALPFGLITKRPTVINKENTNSDTFKFKKTAKQKKKNPDKKHNANK